MNRTHSPPAPARSINRDWAASIATRPAAKPTRTILYGVEGSGKTSTAAHAHKPVFAMSRGETGLLTLIDSGLIPETPHLPPLNDWLEVLSAMEWLAKGKHDHRTVVIDVLNGFERLCHEHVCRSKYNDDWDTFSTFHKGQEVAVAEWLRLLQLLDDMQARGLSVICLCHTKVTKFQNPEGEDYDRYQPDLHKYTWGATHKWADLVGFINFVTFVSVKNPKQAVKGKASGGTQRVLYTQRTAAYDAKERLGLPAEIDLGGSAAEGWKNLSTAVKAAKQAARNRATDDTTTPSLTTNDTPTTEE